MDGEGPEHRVAPPALALPEAQVLGEEQHQAGHESEGDDDQVEAAAEVADPHRSAGDAEEADEAAQLLGGGVGRRSLSGLGFWGTGLTHQTGHLAEAGHAAQVLAIVVLTSGHDSGVKSLSGIRLGGNRRTWSERGVWGPVCAVLTNFTLRSRHARSATEKLLNEILGKKLKTHSEQQVGEPGKRERERERGRAPTGAPLPGGTVGSARKTSPKF